MNYAANKSDPKVFSLDPRSPDDSCRACIVPVCLFVYVHHLMHARMTRSLDRSNRGGQLHMVSGRQVSDWAGSDQLHMVCRWQVPVWIRCAYALLAPSSPHVERNSPACMTLCLSSVISRVREATPVLRYLESARQEQTKRQTRHYRRRGIGRESQACMRLSRL